MTGGDGGRDYSVFVSFAGEDRFQAEMLAEKIEAAGATAFVFSVEARAGADMDALIEAAILDADECLLVATPQSVKRQYVLTELGAFLWSKRPVASVLHRMSARQFTGCGLSPRITGAVALPIADWRTYISALSERISRKQGKP